MRIVIVGPGALGSLLTARIALFINKKRAKGTDNDMHDLLLLDYKPERARQIREAGLLWEEKGQKTLCTVQVETDPEICSGCDVLFLCVKSTAVTEAISTISPFLGPNTLFVAMQNGIGHLDSLSALSAAPGVGITSEGATLIGTGHVRHGGKGITRLGVLGTQTGISTKLLIQTAELLNAAGLETLVTNDPLKFVWGKLFINVAINALTAIHRCPNGELLHSQSTKDMMEKAVNEAVLIAKGLDIFVDGDPVTSAFKVCETTANNISSMHQDVKNQRKTEIDAINGAIVAHGKRLGIPTPVNENLVHQVKRIETSYKN